MDQCATLPSSVTAYRLMHGDVGAFPYLLRDLVGRAALVGIGVRLAGASWRDAAKYGVTGAASIEVFVLAYAAVKIAQRERP